MSTKNGEGPHLAGTGAAYIRVSTDQQDTERQFAAIHGFEQRHGVTIAPQHLFKDEGWARDKADERPEFQRLIKLAEKGVIRWIVVDALDRFGTKDADQLIHYRYRLRECGCKLYDVAGREWTAADIATIITAVVEGDKSKGEQTSKSHRVLGGKAEKAAAGEWQGGPVRFGFDVVCYSRETGKELWRVVFEEHFKRAKVYPDGRTERFDGKGNFPKHQKLTEVLRVAPSKDKGKIDAAVSVFKRYATESISFTALAHHLNGLNFRHGYGGLFHGQHVGCMLEDPIYLGYYTWNKSHSGKFHRWENGRQVAELNYDEHWSKNDKANWVQSGRLFKPLVDQRTWDAVQRKLETRDKRTNAPRTATQYLAGLLVCGNCKGRMVAGPLQRGLHYFCGTYHRAVRERNRAGCKCLRNAVRQEVLEPYIERYLDETGQRLTLLTEGLDLDHLTSRLEQEEGEAWEGFLGGIARLGKYLADYHPNEYGRVHADCAEYGYSSDEAVAAYVDCYRKHFDPARLMGELDQLETEHSRLMKEWGDLPTAMAKEKAKARFAELEARIEEIRQQQQDVAGLVAASYRQVHELNDAVAKAKHAMKSEHGERALRHRAQALRGVIQRIECTFEATDRKKKSGPGNANARLVEIRFFPVSGDGMAFRVDAPDVLQTTGVHSL